MTITKRALFATACGALFLSLTACPLDEANYDPDFFVVSESGPPRYIPQGGGWKPNSTVSISVWGEPIARDENTSDWKQLFDVQVDENGMFGYNFGAKSYPVRRTICGSHAQGQTVTFMAKSGTGHLRMWRPGADLYYTFQPCPR